MYQYIWYMIYIETVVHFFGKYLSWHLTVDWIISWKQNWRKQRGCVFLWKKIKNDLDSLVVWNLYQAQQMQMQRRQVVLQLNKFWQIHFPIPPITKHKPPNTYVRLANTFPNSPKYQQNTNQQLHMSHWQLQFPFLQIPQTQPPNKLYMTIKRLQWKKIKRHWIHFDQCGFIHSLSGGLELD